MPEGAGGFTADPDAVLTGGIYGPAESEARQVTNDERTLITSLRRRTFHVTSTLG
jgi:hypothetical protein